MFTVREFNFTIAAVFFTYVNSFFNWVPQVYNLLWMSLRENPCSYEYGIYAIIHESIFFMCALHFYMYFDYNEFAIIPLFYWLFDFQQKQNYRYNQI